jgi:hypothetical protein
LAARRVSRTREEGVMEMFDDEAAIRAGANIRGSSMAASTLMGC